MSRRSVMIHTLTIDHRHGSNISVFQTAEEAEAELRNWVEHYWDLEVPGTPVPQDAQEAHEEYFERAGESYSLTEAELIIDTDALTQPVADQESWALVESAAQKVVTGHRLHQEDREAALTALGWELGKGLDYGQGLHDLLQAGLALDTGHRLTEIIGVDQVRGLLESRIELLAEYKLEYPQDYAETDLTTMRDEIAALEHLRDRLADLTR